MTKVVFCGTLVKPRELHVASSKGDGTFWTVIPSTLWNDDVCDCPGFRFRGECKHINTLHHCSFWVKPEEYHPENCPLCGEPTVELEMEPEFD